MAQVKISDLSVGDWVECMGERCKVDLPLLNTVFPHAKIYPAYTSATLQPIPITPEVLEKNGWKYETHTIEDINGYDIEYKCYRHTFYRDSYRHDIVLEDSYGGYYQCTIERSIPDKDGELRFISVLCSLDCVEYIHQLQHVLRLAGVEKEIEV